MAADQERADRIRALKQDRPDLTWRRIADYVGVTERSATDWQKKGGIDYANASKLAELFEVDVDYIWRGPVEEERAPSPFAGRDNALDRIDGLESKIDQVLDEVARVVYRNGMGSTVADALAAFTDAIQRQGEAIDRQNTLLEQQSEILGQIRAALTQDQQAADDIRSATESLDGTAARLDASIQSALEGLRSAPQAKPAAARKSAPQRTRQASK